ncbi:hypothetical protein EAH68_13275 [Corynebacterium hylobatis]|uniref:DUF5318 domain-containing protein n=1 Tax=Corynebacterium hylobatis TaxID=1859290 RepID=A0A430HV27_9CORY|nr:DUF5318 family protein [Corynebacterium hylobatis]RSZ61435.1 hypothetical protein EAH68_13275 [Corynebacterium hylobatis]
MSAGNFVRRNEISHRFARQDLLRRWRAGEASRDEVCDADFLLVTAATYHGEPAGYPCPVCGSEDLRIVQWIHGEQLGRMSGTARSDEEIAAIVATGREVTVHTVEVCPTCRWNHLLKAVTATAG